MRLGIGMVHQHFKLVQHHTVLENIALGYKEAPFLFPVRKVAKDLKRLQAAYGLAVNPDAYVWQLSAGEQQRVEILKALFRGAVYSLCNTPCNPLAFHPNTLGMLPYLITLIVLVIAVVGKEARKHAVPAMLGEPYSGEEG